MAVTQVNYTGNGSTTNYSFTFPYLDKTDVQVRIDGTTQATTEYSFANATTIAMDTAPANGAKLVIFRNTNNDSKKGTFYAGSAIKAEDLNDNFDQILYTAQEVDNNAFQTSGDAKMVGDLQMAEDTSIIFEGATDDAHETTLTVADPTADRTITLPNVTGTVVTTGDTGTVTSAMIADATIVNGDIANTTITGGKLVNDTITATQIAANAVTASELADNAVDTAAIAADAVNGTKIADDSINSEHYVDGSIDTAHIADNQVTAAKIATNAVTSTELADNAVDTAAIAANAVTTAKITDANVTTAKIADDAITTGKIADSQVTTAKVANLAISEAKIAASAVTTDKIADNAVTGAKIAAGTLGTTDLADNAITTAKLAADCITGGQIADDAVNSEHYVDASIDTAHIADSQVTTAKIAADAIDATKIADNAVTTDHIADAELTTLAGMQSATASILAAGTDLTATLAEINSVVDGKAPQTTITDDDTKYPTSGAVVDYVAAQIAPLGGLEVIATEVAFPNTQPASGVVISISDAGGVVFNGSGTSTTGRTVGSSTVTINNAPSSLNSETLAAGVGLMVSSTGSGQVYNYHKILGKEDDIKQLSDDINDFNARYRVNAGEPSSNNDEGDLVYDTNADKMKVYDSTTSAWKEVTSTGDFKFLVPVDAGTTTAATWDGSDTSFDLKEATNSGSAASITSVYQLMISVNGVVQKPNTGTYSASEEGFYLTDSDTIRFCTAPPTGSSVFVIQFGSALTITTPGDNTVATAKIQNLAVTTAKIAADAVDGTKIADDAVGAEHIEDLDATVKWLDNAKVRMGTGDDFELWHDGSNNKIAATNGNTHIETGATVEINKGTTENMAKFISDGAVELYYDNSKKAYTYSNGLACTANLSMVDSGKVVFGSGNDLEIYHDGSSNVLQIAANTKIGKSGEASAWFNPDGAVQLFYDNAKHFETIAQGSKATGQLQIDNGDNSYVALLNNAGAGTAYVRNYQGDLLIESPDDTIIESGDSEICAKFIGDGAVELYYDNDLKLFTKSAGAEVTTTGAVANFIVRGKEGYGASITLASDDGDDPGDYARILQHTDEHLYFQVYNAANSAYEDAIVAKHDGAVELYYDNARKLYTSPSGVVIQNDAYFQNDASVLYMGADNDVRIFHSGSNFHIRNTTGNLYLEAKADENSIRCDADGQVRLYYDAVQKFETTSGGVTVTGNVDITGSLGLPDSEKAVFGAGSDLQIYHNGTDSYVENGTGDLYLKSTGDDVIIQAADDIFIKPQAGDSGIEVIGDGAVKLFYDNSWQAKTTSYGFEINGDLRPATDDARDLGSSSYRWDDIYATNSSIQTSDRNEKESITATDLGLAFVNKLTPISFKRKGKTRTHYGLVAQDVETVITDLGKTTTQFAPLIKEDVSENKDGSDVKYGLRYTELISPLIKAVQELSAEVDTLKTKVAALEAK